MYKPGKYLGKAVQGDDLSRREALGGLAEIILGSSAVIVGGKGLAEKAYDFLVGEAWAGSRRELNSNGADLKKKGDYEGAIKYFDEAIRMEPDHPEAYVSKANAMSLWAESIQKDDPDKATELYGESNEYAFTALSILNGKVNLTKGETGLVLICYSTLGFNAKLTGDQESAIRYFRDFLSIEENRAIRRELNKMLQG